MSVGTFTPTFIDVGGAGTVVYGIQEGSYEINSDNVVTLRGKVTGTFTGATGTVGVGGLPATVNNDGNGSDCPGAVAFNNLTLDPGYTQTILMAVAGSDTAIVIESGSGQIDRDPATPNGILIALRFSLTYRAAS
jgi:hypothetical protein